ncbi:MAG: hypothetical protein Fur0025_32090 [Oscillatoriaceae cyanobacterium]
MNIYFLLEGRSTEKKVYRSWLQHLLPELQEVKQYEQAGDKNYFLISAHGYPSIIHEYIPDAIERIQETGKYEYLVVCIDAEEDDVDSKKREITDFISQEGLWQNLGHTKLILIIQNRCIETWFLGNRKMFDSRQPLAGELSDYVNYYDVSVNDPELMGNYKPDYNHAEFHQIYLKAIFDAKGRRYTKNHPGDVQEKYYLQQLIKRVDESRHIPSFQVFIDFCNLIKDEIAQ